MRTHLERYTAERHATVLLAYARLEGATGVGATVIFLNFGQTESLKGRGTLPSFVAAYEKMIDENGVLLFHRIE